MSSYKRKIGDVIVTKTTVLGTNHVVYSAWEPGTTATHYTIMSSIDDEVTWHGRIDTVFPPEAFEALRSNTEERRRAVGLWQVAAKKRALAYVYVAFPEVLDLAHSIDGGQVVLEGEHV
jgi:hypothetical protein